MKKLLLFIALLAIMSSCAEDSIKVENPEKITTLEITELAKKDTAWYKVVIIDKQLFAVNEKSRVVYSVKNYSGDTKTLTLFLIAFVILLFVALSLYNDAR